MTRKSTEAAIQRALVAWLGDHYKYVMVQATLNENSRTHMGMGCTVGIPDLLLFWRCNGTLNVLFLELKTKTGRLSQSQTGWKSAWYDCFIVAPNSHYAVAHGFGAAKKVIEKIITP